MDILLLLIVLGYVRVDVQLVVKYMINLKFILLVTSVTLLVVIVQLNLMLTGNRLKQLLICLLYTSDAADD